MSRSFAQRAFDRASLFQALDPATAQAALDAATCWWHDCDNRGQAYAKTFDVLKAGVDARRDRLAQIYERVDLLGPFPLADGRWSAYLTWNGRKA